MSEDNLTPQQFMERSGEYSVEQLERKRLLDLVPEHETFATLERIAVERQWFVVWKDGGGWVSAPLGTPGARLDLNRAAIAFCGAEDRGPR